MRSRFILLFACAAMSLPACRQHNTPMLMPKGSPNLFQNGLQQTAYVNILHTPGQASLNFNKIALLRQITVPAGATVHIGDSLMETDKAYLLDWHSADYTYSNYVMRLPQNYQPFRHYPLEADSTVLLSGDPDLYRLYCLNGNGKATHWQSVNAYNAAGVSVWDTLMSKKYHSVYMDIVGQFYDTARLYPDQLPALLLKSDFTNTHFRPEKGSFTISAGDYILTNDLRPQAPLYSGSSDSLYLMRMKPGIGSANVELPYFLLVKTQTVPLK
jgi:hypothetical protein